VLKKIIEKINPFELLKKALLPKLKKKLNFIHSLI